MKTRAILLYIAVLLTSLLSTAGAGLKSDISRIISQPSQKNVRWGIQIIDAGKGKTLYSLNANQPMIPASNMKLVTTAAALHYLGQDYVYQTTVAIKDRTLVIIGSGDPLLGDRITDAKYSRGQDWLFNDIAQIILSQDIKSIEDIIIDTGVFDDERVHPDWPAAELNRWYACEVCGLNFSGNCIEITAVNRSGEIQIDVEPKSSFVKIINRVRPVSTKNGAVGAYRTEKINTIIVKGRCRKQQGPFRVAIERPAAMFGFLLADHLNKNGIAVTGQVAERNLSEKTGLRILKVYKTPLTDCLIRANKDSFGLAAEAMVKTIASSVQQNRNGSWQSGQRLISEYLITIGIDPDEFFINDGSGLSKKNLLSPDAITTVLHSMYKGNNRQIYRQSLAVGGSDGTIDKYFNEPEYKGKIIGKTGYINSVKSFSGCVSTGGKDYIFSIITSKANGKTRTAINSIAKAIIDNSSD